MPPDPRLNRPRIALRPNRFGLAPEMFPGGAVIHCMTIPKVLLKHIVYAAILLTSGHQFERLQERLAIGFTALADANN